MVYNVEKAREHWHIGDIVFYVPKDCFYRVHGIETDTITLAQVFRDHELMIIPVVDWYLLKGLLVHIGAVRFDDMHKPVSIDYDYTPARDNESNTKKWKIPFLVKLIGFTSVVFVILFLLGSTVNK